MNLFREITKVTFDRHSLSCGRMVAVEPEADINFNNLILSLLVTTIFNVVIKKVAEVLLEEELSAFLIKL